MSTNFRITFQFKILDGLLYVEEDFEGSEDLLKAFVDEAWVAPSITFGKKRLSYPIRNLMSIRWEQV